MLVSVNVGMPKDVPWQGKTVHTGVWKYPVRGPAMVRRLNLEGDGQGDLAGHGGEQRAVLVYQLDSYRHWQQHFERADFGYGQFGENLTVDGMADGEVCIGDRYRIGEAEFEVTQPRVTCYRVGLRLGEPELPALLVSHHRPGFYMRVITEGKIQAGDAILKTRTGPGAGITAPIGNGRGSVLDLADACDVPTRWSCRTGVCHTCATPLLSGEISYSPQPLEPPPDGQVLICCARPSTDLVLDM